MIIGRIGATTTPRTSTGKGVVGRINTGPALQVQPTPTEPIQITPNQKKIDLKELAGKAKPIFEAGKKLISQLTGYIKAVKERPFEAAAGAGTKVIQSFGGDLVGTIQQGVASVAGIDIPDRWNLKKQAKAFEELNRMNLGAEDKESISAKAFETGKFIGSFVPYYFAGAVAGASVGTKILAPVATKFIPKAVKLVPVISNAIGFTGVGQLEYDKEVDGARVDRLKTDLVMLALFEVGGALAKGIAKGTSKIISKTINGISNKIKSGDKISIAEIEKTIAETKTIIAKDTGKPAEVVLANNIAGASEKEIKAITPKKVSEVVPAEKLPLKPTIEAPEAGKPAIVAPKPIEKVPQAELYDQPAKQVEMLKNMTSGTGKFNAGEVYTQIGQPQARKIIIQGKDAEGNIIGNYIMNDGLSPAKFKPEELQPYKVVEQAKQSILEKFGIKSVAQQPLSVPTKGVEKPQISAPTPPPSPIKKVSLPQAPKVVSPTEKFQSRVFERLKADHPQLEGELTYDPIKLKDQAKKAVDLIVKDKQKAFDVAMGKEPQKEVTSTAVNIAMSEKALDEGNHELYAKLIKTRSLEQTRRGQELVSEKASLDDNSTSRYVKELISTRLNNVGKKYLSGLKEGAISNKEHAVEVISRKAGELERKIINKKLDVRTALKLLDELACI